jgi:hypothetical protein
VTHPPAFGETFSRHAHLDAARAPSDDRLQHHRHVPDALTWQRRGPHHRRRPPTAVAPVGSCRIDVVDIDHPGNVVALLGGIVTFSGMTNLGVTAVSCRSALSNRNECTASIGLMSSFLAVGAGMLTWGLWTWLTSRSLVPSTLETAQTVPPAPLAPEPAVPPSARLVPRLR